MCAGQFGECQAAVHATTEIFQDNETQVVLLVDTSNAFNRSVMLHNIDILCPNLAKFAENCYTQKIRIFVIGGRELSSTEGRVVSPIWARCFVWGLDPIYNVFFMVFFRCTYKPNTIRHFELIY